MVTNLKKTSKEVTEVIDNCLITKYNSLFSKYLQNLSPSTRDIIRKTKELDELFDLFLDFILDSSQQLDYKIAKENEENIEKH